MNWPAFLGSAAVAVTATYLLNRALDWLEARTCTSVAIAAGAGFVALALVALIGALP